MKTKTAPRCTPCKGDGWLLLNIATGEIGRIPDLTVLDYLEQLRLLPCTYCYGAYRGKLAA